MPKVTPLETISNIGGNPTSAAANINTNSASIEAGFENTLSRDGSTPNEMLANLDMNSNRVINMADGVNPQDGVTVSQLEGVFSSGLLDGNKGDITVSGGAADFSINAGVVTTTELGGDITTAGKALLDDADAAAQRATLGLGSAAQANFADFAPASHQHTAAQISNYLEAFQDTLADSLQGGPGILVNYNDTTGIVTVSSTTGGVGGGSGIVETVVAGHGVDVDATNPVNPIVAVDETELDHGLISGLLDDDHTQYLTTARHAAIDAADHTSGTATDGYVLTADGLGGAAWEAPATTTDHGTLAGLADDDHAQYLNTARHAAIDAADHGSGAATDGYVLTADGVGGSAWEVIPSVDHGALVGLSDDDHTQYLLASGTRALAGAWSLASFTLNNVGVLDVAEVADPGLAAANHINVFGLDVNGFSQIHHADSTRTWTIPQDQYIICRNATGLSLTVGQVVYVSGTTGQRPEIMLADADVHDHGIGLVADAVAANGYTRVVVGGLLTKVDTSAWTAGDALYLSTDIGTLQNTEPAHPASSQAIGRVIYSHAVNGIIYVHHHTDIRHTDGTFHTSFTLGDSPVDRVVLDIAGSALTGSRSFTFPDSSGVITINGHTHVSTDITDFAEAVDDRVAALIVAGNNIDVTYNDVANTFTIDVEALTSADITDFSEAVDDRVAALVVAGNNIDVTYDDAANTLTIDVESLTSADITDFSEAVDDRVGALVVGGSGVDATYNDGAGTLTLDLDINGLTAEATVDSAADYFVMYDASAAAHRKVLGSNMPGGGGGGGTGGDGSLVYTGGATVAGAAATTLTLSGLDLDADEAYFVSIEMDNATAGVANVSFYYNSDTTAGNYDTQLGVVFGSSVAAARANNAILLGAAANQPISLIGWMRRNVEGNVRFQGTMAREKTTSLDMMTFAHHWRTASTNVTGITLSSSAASGLAIGTSIKVWRLKASAAGDGHQVQGRLTLTSGTPVTTSDVTGATSVYFTPYNGNAITLWTGSLWREVPFTEKTLALGTLTSGLPYDVFGYLSSGTLALEALAWTNDTTRATAVTLQDGRYCKSGDKTRLYLGTFYTTSTTTTEDSATKRYLFNQYNRAKRVCYNTLEGTNSWTYTTATWRQANANTANQFDFVNGDPATLVEARVLGIANNGAAAGTSIAVGIGLDSTSANSARHFGCNVTSNDVNQLWAEYQGYPGIGRHYLTWLEYSGASSTTTWFGDAGLVQFQAGMYGQIDA